MIVADSHLAARIELAFAAGAVAFVDRTREAKPSTGAAYRWIGGGVAIYGGPQDPVCRALAIGSQQPVSVAHLDEVTEFYRSRGMAAKLEVGPLNHESLLACLAERACRITLYLNVFARSLEGGLPEPSPEVEVSPVRVADADTFADVVGRGFSEGNPPPPHMADRPILALRSPGVRGFLARVDGRPAGGGSMSLHEGVACFNGGSTLPEFRRRGVQRSLLVARLAEAEREVCDVAAVQCRPGTASERNIARTGFRLMYTKAIVELL